MVYFPGQTGGFPNYGWLQPTTVTKVRGREGALGEPLGPNSSIIYPDATNPIVWFKQTDAAGYPTVNGYSITPLVEPQEIMPKPQVDTASLVSKIDNISSRLANLESELGLNGKPDSGSSKQSK